MIDITRVPSISFMPKTRLIWGTTPPGADDANELEESNGSTSWPDACVTIQPVARRHSSKHEVAMISNTHEFKTRSPPTAVRYHFLANDQFIGLADSPGSQLTSQDLSLSVSVPIAERGCSSSFFSAKASAAVLGAGSPVACSNSGEGSYDPLPLRTKAKKVIDQLRLEAFDPTYPKVEGSNAEDPPRNFSFLCHIELVPCAPNEPRLNQRSCSLASRS